MRNPLLASWAVVRGATVGLVLVLLWVAAPALCDEPTRPAVPPPPATRPPVTVTPAKGQDRAPTAQQGTFDDVTFDTPDTRRWKPEVKEGNLVFAATDAAAPDFAQITVFASQDFTGDSEAFQKAFTQAISHDLYQRGVTKLLSAPPLEPTVAGGAEILRRLVTAEGKPTNQHSLYVGIHAGNRMEMVAYQTNSPETYARFQEEAQRFFQNINVHTPGAADEKPKPATERRGPVAPPVNPPDARGTAAAGGGFGAMLRTVKPDAIKVVDGAGAAQLPPAMRGDRQIDGLFRYAKSATMLSPDMRRIIPHLDVRYFYFFPDGHVFFGIPPGGVAKEHPTTADFAYFKAGYPGDCGTYVIARGKITITSAGADGGHGDEYEFALGNPPDGTAFNFSGAVVSKLFPFARGERLAGAYVNDQVVGDATGDSTSFVVSTLTFGANGTVGSDHWTGLEARSEPKLKNDTVRQVTSADAGTYQLDGYRLTLNVDGQTRTATVCRLERDTRGQPPAVLFIDAHTYSLKQ